MTTRFHKAVWFLLTGAISSAFAAPDIANDYQNAKRASVSGFAASVTPAWEFLPAFVGGGFGRPVVSTDGVVYAHGINSDPNLYAVSAEGLELWRYDTGSSHFASVGPAIGPDGTVYSVSGSGALHAIGANGIAKWVALTEIGGAEVRVLPSNRVVVSSPTGIQVFDTNGNSLSTRIVSGFFLTPWLRAQPVFSPDGAVYYSELARRHPSGIFGVNEVILEARALETHELLWQHAEFAYYHERPELLLGWDKSGAVDDAGNLFVHACTLNTNALDCSLRSFNPDGTLRWQGASKADNVGVVLGGLTPDNQTLVVRCDVDAGGNCAPELGVVTGIDANTGATRWTVFQEPSGLRRPFDSLVDSTGRPYYFALGAGQLSTVVRIDPATPNEQWATAPVPFVGWDTIAIGPNRRLYSSGTRIHAFDQTGFVPNVPPTANAGPDKTTVVGKPVPLDGSASADPDGDALRFAWAIESGPSLESTQLAGADQPSAILTPRIEGLYTVALVVNDGVVDSAIDRIAVQVLTPLQCATSATNALLSQLVDGVGGSFATNGHRIALSEFARQGLAALELGQQDLALHKYAEITRRVDGCLVRGEPDVSGYEKDWIVDCTAASAIHGFANKVLACMDTTP